MHEETSEGTGAGSQAWAMGLLGKLLLTLRLSRGRRKSAVEYTPQLRRNPAEWRHFGPLPPTGSPKTRKRRQSAGAAMAAMPCHPPRAPPIPDHSGTPMTMRALPPRLDVAHVPAA